MAPKLGGLLRIGVGSFAAGVIAALTEEALATGDSERDDDAIAHFQLAGATTDLDDLSHRLVAQHVTAFHAGNDAVIDMEIRTTDRAAGYTDDSVPGILERRIGDRLTPHVT